MFERHDRVNEPLHVIAPIYNPGRWRTRWKLFEDFAKRCSEAGAILHVIEAAFGNRDHVLIPQDTATHFDGEYEHIRVRTGHELWLKENLINVAVSKLPSDWKYVAWVDADVTFARDDWADETIHQLQHYSFVQMWSQYQDICPDYQSIGMQRSFMDCYMNGGPSSVGKNKPPSYPYYYGDTAGRGYPGAPGLAWACRRDAWDAVGGLFDFGILGAGDWYMAHAMIGRYEKVIRMRGSKRFNDLMFEWQARCEKHIKRNVGVVKGLALHHFHGRKALRQYKTRDEILIENKYDPDYDLKRDWQGVYQLTDRSIGLRDGIRKYFRQRNEDATDL
jgi:hypothetical protein